MISEYLSLELLFAIVFFVSGTAVGSFLNVCIHRLPLNKSIVFPGSHCPSCKTPIKPHDNIPILSYLILGGKCRKCAATISIRYPIVEFMGGLFALAVFYKYGMTISGFVHYIYIASLIVITFIDLDHRIIPDVISLPGIVLFILAQFILPGGSVKYGLIGLLTGGGILYSVAFIYQLLTGREGMGGGDIKLLAMIGALTGWIGVVFTLFMASALGAVIGITLMLLKGENMKLAIPFGPFLASASILYLFFGMPIILWYVHIMRP